MAEETVYRCDLTGERIDKEDAVPVTVRPICADTSPRSHSNETVLSESNAPSNAEHISANVLNDAGFQDMDFNELEIITLDGDVVGWRDYSPSTVVEPQRATDEQKEFLRQLTYLSI